MKLRKLLPIIAIPFLYFILVLIMSIRSIIENGITESYDVIIIGIIGMIIGIIGMIIIYFTQSLTMRV